MSFDAVGRKGVEREKQIDKSFKLPKIGGVSNCHILFLGNATKAYF
jgi:hypothetical protein